MGSLFSALLLLITVFSSSPSPSSSSRAITSPRMLDLLVRDYITNLSSSTANNSIETGVPRTIILPANLFSVTATVIRLRCGSLRRYGAQINEFQLPASGAIAVLPCVERALLIRQSLHQNWSKFYYDSYDFRSYHLISPILGLFAYNAGEDADHQSNAFELGVYASAKAPIKIDFRTTGISSNTLRARHYCATFESGKIKLLNMIAPLVCVAEKEGHFALVAEAPPQPPPAPAGEQKTPAADAGEGEGEGEGRASRWKVALGSSVGAALGAFLLGLLLIAMVVRAKQKTKVEEERVRRAYEEEALQVSMVGHVRAPVAAGSRTAPAIEHHYRPSPRTRL